MNSIFLLSNNSRLSSNLTAHNISKDIYLYSSSEPKKYKSKKFVLNIFGTIEGSYENELLVKKSITNIFKSINKKEELFNCINNCEGRFVIIVEFKNETYVVLDKYSKKDIFFSQLKSDFYISDSFKNILKYIGDLSFNNLALSNQFLVSGSKSAKKDTIFNEIKRLGLNQILLIKNNKIKIISHSFNSRSEINYNDDMIDKYYEINKSFMSNFGDKQKGLFMSSGFDSSYLLALQQKLLGSKNIIGLTCVQKFSHRSGIYNKFEIDRVKKLSNFYDIKNYFVDVNLRDNFQDLSEETSEVCAHSMNTNHLSSMMFYKIAKLAKTKLQTKTVMSGEISDGAHNLGFSQFLTSFNHESQGYREYSDKKFSYLYTPSFLEKVSKNTSTDDYIFNELSNNRDVKYQNNNVSKKSNFFKNIFNDLFNSSTRFPFENIESKILKQKLIDKSKNYHSKNYFEEIKITKFNQLYSSYLQLYNSFHWQASTVSPLFYFSDRFNLNMTLPFWGHGVQNFLSEMPSDWGRGLEIKNIKYPLKESFRRKMKYPKFIEEGFHSYRYDEKKYEDPIFEIINNKTTKNYMIKILKKYHPCEYLDQNYFRTNQINNILKKYISGKNYTNESNNIYSLYLFSKLLFDIKF